MTKQANTTQVRELANAIALQADAIAKDPEMTDQALSVQVARILENAQTLRAWVPVNQ